jgi:NADH-quinone oxidoreductase subunit G
LGHTLPYDNIAAVRTRMTEINSNFSSLNSVAPAQWAPFGTANEMGADAFRSPIDNFYMTDPISRVSGTMAECARVLGADPAGKTDTDG